MIKSQNVNLPRRNLIFCKVLATVGTYALSFRAYVPLRVALQRKRTCKNIRFPRGSYHYQSLFFLLTETSFSLFCGLVGFFLFLRLSIHCFIELL